MSSICELIDSLRLLIKEAPVILASPEDAAYFRSSTFKKPEAPPPILKSAAQPFPVKQPDPPSSQIEVLTKPQPQPEPENSGGAVDLRRSQNSRTNEQGSEPEKPRPSAAVSSMRTLLAKIAPELAILDEIPNDSIARKIATRWKTKNQSAPISVLSGGELPQHRVFLEEITATLDVYFGGAKIVQVEPIEKENQWESFLGAEGLKLILICDSTLWQLHQLRRFYKETPSLGARMLGKTPLFLLPDLSLYLKDPQLKRSLWKALQKTCSAGEVGPRDR